MRIRVQDLYQFAWGLLLSWTAEEHCPSHLPAIQEGRQLDPSSPSGFCGHFLEQVSAASRLHWLQAQAFLQGFREHSSTHCPKFLWDDPRHSFSQSSSCFRLQSAHDSSGTPLEAYPPPSWPKALSVRATTTTSDVITNDFRIFVNWRMCIQWQYERSTDFSIIDFSQGSISKSLHCEKKGVLRA